MAMDTSELRDLIKMFEQAAITELEYDVEGVKIRLKKDMSQTPVPDANPEVRSQPASGKASVEEEMPAESSELPVIESPMVGVFYRSPGPDAPPFVEPSDYVAEGQTICIIEAMKIMNEIPAPMSGKLVQALVESGEPVEFGQPLFVLEPVQV
jgi:acetyl-CoA carboxylase biotin carboxyl carrier protein